MAAPSMQIAPKEGYLEKKGEGSIFWQNRWFSLDQNAILTYFVNDKKQEQKGSIDLRDILKITSEKPCFFELYHNKGRVYELWNKDQFSANDWVHHLRLAHQLVLQGPAVGLNPGPSNPQGQQHYSSPYPTAPASPGYAAYNPNAAPAFNPEIPLEYSAKDAMPSAPYAPPPDTSADEELARKLQAAELKEGSLPSVYPTAAAASLPPAYPGLPAQPIYVAPHNPQPQVQPAAVAVAGYPVQPAQQHPVRFRIRERFWCLSQESIIFSQDNLPTYVTRPVVSIGDKIHFYLYGTNQECAFIQQKLRLGMPHYEIYIWGRHIATIKQKFALLTFKYEIEVIGQHGSDLKVDGDWLGYEFTFSRRGHRVGSVSRKFFSYADEYGVEIMPGEDPLLVLCSAVVIDLTTHSGHEQAHGPPVVYGAPVYGSADFNNPRYGHGHGYGHGYHHGYGHHGHHGHHH